MKNKILLFVLIFCTLIIMTTGCDKNNDVNVEEKTNETKEEKKVEKLTQEDDLILYLMSNNNNNYYRPLVKGYSNSNEKYAGVEKHLLYFENEYVYDINLNNFADKNMKFEDVPLDSREKYKYKIVETRLQSDDEEIYLKAESSSTEEFHMFFQYYSNISNALYIYVGRPGYYYVYDYYYEENTALNVARSRVESYTTKKPSVGMSESQVKNSEWGTPDKVNRDTYSWGTVEQWVYNDRGYIYFRNGVVTSISER